MSAENAWRIAREAAAKVCPRDADPYGCSSDYAIGYESGSQAAADDVLSLPMPPAFRAEVEAEAEELRGMLAELIGEVLEHCDGRQDVNWESDGPNAEMRLGNVAREIEARLARLEAKEEVSLRPLPDAAFEPRPAGWGEGGKDE